MDPATIVATIVSIVQGAIALAEHLGQRDAALAALDGLLAAHRAKVDAELRLKHHADLAARSEQDTQRVEVPGPERKTR